MAPAVTLPPPCPPEEQLNLHTPGLWISFPVSPFLPPLLCRCALSFVPSCSRSYRMRILVFSALSPFRCVFSYPTFLPLPLFIFPPLLSLPTRIPSRNNQSNAPSPPQPPIVPPYDCTWALPRRKNRNFGGMSPTCCMLLFYLFYLVP